MTHEKGRPLLPPAHETAGRLGQAALRHLRWLARDQAQAFGDGPEAEAAAGALVRRWSAELSCALHRATARQLRTALGQERELAARAALAAELAG